MNFVNCEVQALLQVQKVSETKLSHALVRFSNFEGKSSNFFLDGVLINTRGVLPSQNKNPSKNWISCEVLKFICKTTLFSERRINFAYTFWVWVFFVTCITLFELFEYSNALYCESWPKTSPTFVFSHYTDTYIHSCTVHVHATQSNWNEKGNKEMLKVQKGESFGGKGGVVERLMWRQIKFVRRRNERQKYMQWSCSRGKEASRAGDGEEKIMPSGTNWIFRYKSFAALGWYQET